MAKRGKANREGEEWLSQVTSEHQDYFVSWKSAKWWPVGPKGRGPKRDPVGDRVTGVINLVTGALILLIPLTALLLYGWNGDRISLIIVGFFIIGLGFIFIRAGIEHIRYSK